MGHRLQALDNLFLQLETQQTPMHVGGVLLFRGDDEGAARYARLKSTPVAAEPFDLLLRPARLPGQRPSWQKLSSVDLDAHVHRVAAPSGPPTELMELVSRIHGARISRGRPMWQCHLLEGLSGGRYGYYYKVHHSCIDGVSAIRRMQQGLSAAPDEDTPPLWAYQPARRRRLQQASSSALSQLTEQLGSTTRVVREIAAALREMTRRRDSAQPGAVVPFTAPASCLNYTTTSGQRTVAWQRLPLEALRAIGKAAGATINEVFVAVVAGVLRADLLARGELPDEPLVALLPVSLREVNDGPGGNRLSCLLCNLGTHLADPIARLQTIVSSSRDGKRMLGQMSADAAAAYAIVINVPAIAAMMLGVYSRLRLPCNLVISNVPGPRQPLYDRGAQLEAIYPVSMLWDRQAINVTAISYRDEMHVGLLGTREGIGDAPALTELVRRELDLLHHAVLGERAAVI